MAKLVAIVKSTGKRVLGQYKGEVVIAGDFGDTVDPETFSVMRFLIDTHC